MAFVLKQQNSYSWPVKFDVPEDGHYRRETFEVEFKNISQTRFQELIELSQSGDFNDVDIVREVVVGWSGILDDKNEEVPFTKARFEKLLDVLGLATAIATAFVESRMGGAAKRKN